MQAVYRRQSKRNSRISARAKVCKAHITAGLGNRPITVPAKGCFLLLAEDACKKRLGGSAESHDGINEGFG
jgi:hypothetical protein